MTLPKCLTNPKLQQVKLRSGRFVVVERLADQHYLIWSQGKPLTEVMCVPTGSGRWYWRGAGLSWKETRLDAIQEGIFRGVKGTRVSGGQLEAWSEQASAVIAENKQRLG